MSLSMGTVCMNVTLENNFPLPPPVVQNHISGTEFDPREISKKFGNMPLHSVAESIFLKIPIAFQVIPLYIGST